MFAWYVLVSKFTDAIRLTWGAGAAAKVTEKKEVAKKVEAKKEDDVDDLFGDDDEVDEEAKKAMEDAKAKAKGGDKKKVIAKSLIIFDVKPWEIETNLDELAKTILAITLDGLFWKTEFKKEPIAYGIHKLVIGCVVEDDKIGVDDLQAKIEELEDYVQSVDIAVFSKI